MATLLLPDLADIEDLLALIGPGADRGQAEQALRWASARFRGDVRHPVNHVTDDVVWLDGTGTRTVLLPAAPVTDVASVEVNGEVISDFEWSETGVLRRQGCWPDQLRSIKVTYSHGYDPIPDDIADVVLAHARYAYETIPGLSSMQVGGQTMSWSAAAFDAGVSEAWARTVEAHRLNRGDAA